MSEESEIQSLALCYFRNLVARCYREARYIGTTGKYPPLEKYYQACRYKLAYGGTWVKPLFDQVMAETDVQTIEEVFAERLDGLTLEQLKQAFACGTWSYNVGGKRWAQIVETTITLGSCLQKEEKGRLQGILSSVDELQHNTKKVVEDFIRPCR
jgi:hypothetical protein